MGRGLTAAERAMDPAARFWSYVDRRGPNDCWNWKRGVTKAGYPVFMAEGRRNTYTHRWAWEFTTGEQLPPEVLVLHRCDNKRCCNPAHLLKGNYALNNRDACQKQRRGGLHRSKLSYEIACSIREAAAAGIRLSVLADTYGVTYAAVRHIVRGSGWSAPPPALLA
jgi:HNH endonuclease